MRKLASMRFQDTDVWVRGLERGYLHRRINDGNGGSANVLVVHGEGTQTENAMKSPICDGDSGETEAVYGGERSA